MPKKSKKVKGPKTLVIDNYDSFTYNLVQYLGELGCRLQVFRNDRITLPRIERLKPDRIVISPGPGVPARAGISKGIIEHFYRRTPILGVCLGHQAIGEVFGGRVVRAPELKHGKTSKVHHGGDELFRGLPSPFQATRYHSLIVDREGFPETLEVTAWTENGLVMGLRHHRHPLFGVQFHPESIMTPEGKDLLRNFLCCGG